MFLLILLKVHIEGCFEITRLNKTFFFLKDQCHYRMLKYVLGNVQVLFSFLFTILNEANVALIKGKYKYSIF